MHIAFLPIGSPRGIPLSQVMFPWMETTHGIVEIDSERRGTRKSQEARQRSKNKIRLSTEPRTSAQP